jgi:Tol biopolymer transport system component
MPIPAGTPLLGRRLAHYQILERLGAGGMGEVYLAHDLKLDRDVALKLLPEEWSQSVERRKRLEHEAKAIASLDHPNVVTVHSVEEAEGLLFITMEAIRGRRLTELIPPKGFDLERWFGLAIPIAEAVAAAHGAGVIHRDLKPDNVMVRNDGRVKVLDFGLARLDVPNVVPPGSDFPTRSATGDGRIAGTIAYMSPEQAQGKRLDPRTDVFSLGVVLYQMATGRRPFDGDNPSAILASILKEEPRPIEDLRPRLPKDLSRVVHRCLEKEAVRRFQTAADLRTELERLQAALHDRPKGSRLLWRWLGAGASLAIGLALVYAATQGPPSRTEYANRPITGRSGLEWMPSASPDGSLLAYAHPTENGFDIFVVPMTGGDPVLITKHEGEDVRPAWSPDGTQIAFISDRGGNAAIYLVPALGGAARKLVDTGISFVSDYSLALRALGSQPWSPDGRAILFSRAGAGGEVAIWSVNVSTGEKARMTSPPSGWRDRGATWSFDGERFAFTRTAPGSFEIWSFEEGREALLIPDEHINAHPAWLPDGRAVVFVSERSGFGNLWLFDVESSRIRQITSGPGKHEHPSVLRNGSILYNDFDNPANLFSLELDSGAQEQMTFNSRFNAAPKWSPDGTKLVYTSDRTGNHELWLLDSVSGSERRLTDHPASDLNADWSPDGGEIVFVSDRDGAARLWILDVESGAARRLSPDPVRRTSYLYYHPRWSPDGQAIAYRSPDGALSVVNPATSESKILVKSAEFFDWYLDGRRLVYARKHDDRVMELLVRDLETGEEALLDTGNVQELSVASDGGSIVFCRGWGDTDQEIFVLPLSEPAEGGLPRSLGPPRQLTEGAGQWHAHNPAWFRDGKRLVFVRSPVEGDVYALEPVPGRP